VHVRPTIAQVAELSGVSRAAVSEVLNDKGQRFRPETRRRVLDVATRLGYRPNATARAVRRGKLGCVALLQSDTTGSGYVPGELLRGIQEALARSRTHLVMARLPHENLTSESYVPRILEELLAEGLLINYHYDVPEEMRRLIQENAVPSVWTNVKRDSDCVYPDDLGIAEEATRRLIRRGHSRIAYVDYSHDPGAWTHHSGQDRHEGYLRAMREAGLVPLSVVRHVAAKERVAFSAEWLSGGERPTAVLAHSGGDAVSIALAASGLPGVSPGRDLHLTCFVDTPYEVTWAPVEPVALPWFAVGRAAVEMLERKIAEGGRLQPSVVVGPPGPPSAGGGRA
jgi:LacI family transcriptional regulator